MPDKAFADDQLVRAAQLKLKQKKINRLSNGSILATCGRAVGVLAGNDPRIISAFFCTWCLKYVVFDR